MERLAKKGPPAHGVGIRQTTRNHRRRAADGIKENADGAEGGGLLKSLVDMSAKCAPPCSQNGD